MGAKVGCVVLDTDRVDLAGAATLLAVEECLAVGVEVADLYVATCVSVAPLFATAPDRRVMILALRAEPRGPGADALAEALAKELDLGVMTAFVNDFYASGGYQIWGPQRSGLLVDFEVTIAGSTITYLDAPRFGIAHMLGIDPQPAEGRRLSFLEELSWADGDGHDLRIIEDGRALDAPRRLAEDDALDWAWLSAQMAWPMMDGAARRQMRHRSK